MGKVLRTVEVSWEAVTARTILGIGASNVTSSSEAKGVLVDW